MKVKNWVVKDKEARLAYKGGEIKYVTLQSLLANAQLPWSYKFYWSYLFHRSGLYKRLSFFRHSCLWTGRGRSVFRFFKFSRHWCKHFASCGILVGMRKSSF